MWRNQQEPIGISDSKPADVAQPPQCQHNKKEPCILREYTEAQCNLCRTVNYERLMIMDSLKGGICEVCGADKKAYLETMHTPCSMEHGIGAGRGKLNADGQVITEGE